MPENEVVQPLVVPIHAIPYIGKWMSETEWKNLDISVSPMNAYKYPHCFALPEQWKTVVLSPDYSDLFENRAIDSTIGKMMHEENNAFANQKKTIVWLYFEDDTLRPVLKVEDDHMEIIQKWYDDCEICFSYEETETFIPETITAQDVSGILFKDIDYKYKTEYIEQYIPTSIKCILSERTKKEMEKKIFVQHVPAKKAESFHYVDERSGITHVDGKSKKENAKIHSMGIVLSKYIQETSMPQLKVPDSEPSPYNEEYNVLSPSFASNCMATESNCMTASNCMEMTSSLEVNNIWHNKFSDYINYYNENLCDLINFNKSQNKNRDVVYVLLNEKFLKTLVLINPNQSEKHVIEHHSEFGFFKLFEYSTEIDELVIF